MLIMNAYAIYITPCYPDLYHCYAALDHLVIPHPPWTVIHILQVLYNAFVPDANHHSPS